ncbi:hypothetical protein MLD38_001785 [Melastoma candidum]|uniref:Uncharacterized protein n=1 Tax=Melastoma candidum TaxID=119954 RepID=A0ACB9SHM5_9MYRT|nr:hypothetical protein MLD38_001785 [Melastoma candidum]
MASGFESSGTESSTGDSSDFECNICFDLAQDPIVTLCGHLFCWPCLYKWLHLHSHSRECPVCKALVEEEKLVPLYGRGKSSSDPRTKSVPGVNIPHRPAGQRPETAPPPEPNYFPQHGFGSMGGLGGFAPAATARFGNFTASASFGGFIPSLFNFHVHGYHDPNGYGAAPGIPFGFPHTFHGGHGLANMYRHRGRQGHQDDFLKKLLLFIGFCVILVLIWN